VRVLIATFHRNLVGGTEKYLQALLPGLAGRGHQIGLVHERPTDPSRETIDSASIRLAAWCLADLGLEPLMQSVAQWRPDIVYSQGLENGELEAALVRAYPTVLYAHGYYGTCATGSKSHAFPQHTPCERRFGPACLLLHYPRRCGGLSPWTAWRNYRRQAERQALFSEYRSVLVASTHMYREFQRNGVSPDRLRVVPLPPPDGAPPALPPAQAAPGGRVLMIGRLTALKGGHYLIPAISRASAQLGRQLTLTIAGDGSERPRLEDLARKFQVSVDFAGWVNSQRIMEHLRATDVLAVPSLWPEPFGLVGIEAARLGVPAVGYAVGGIPDWLIPGETGELAPGDPPTIEGLADAIVRLAADPGHYAELCQGAWRNAGRYSLEAHLTRLELTLGDGRNTAPPPSHKIPAAVNL
jgi:glycosyltransferase involved in cell wall biosynthesis